MNYATICYHNYCKSCSYSTQVVLDTVYSRPYLWGQKYVILNGIFLAVKIFNLSHFLRFIKQQH